MLVQRAQLGFALLGRPPPFSLAGDEQTHRKCDGDEHCERHPVVGDVHLERPVRRDEDEVVRGRRQEGDEGGGDAASHDAGHHDAEHQYQCWRGTRHVRPDRQQRRRRHHHRGRPQGDTQERRTASGRKPFHQNES